MAAMPIACILTRLGKLTTTNPTMASRMLNTFNG